MPPVIGVMPLVDYARQCLWMLPGYLKMLEAAGAVPLMLPLTDSKQTLSESLKLCQGLLFTGGQDVEPKVYGAPKSPRSGEVSPLRDAMESFLMRRALELDLPILGICRGLQFMNAFLGGTLYQDLPTELEGSLKHMMDKPYERIAHTVKVLEWTPLYEITGCRELNVNSCHHQGVKDLAPALKPCAIAPDGLCEAAFMPGKRFVLGVQWHPEIDYTLNVPNRLLIEAFCQDCA